MTKVELELKLDGVLDGIQMEHDNCGQLIIYTDRILDEDAFNEILSRADVGDADDDGQLLIYTGLKEEDGQLVDFDED